MFCFCRNFYFFMCDRSVLLILSKAFNNTRWALARFGNSVGISDVSKVSDSSNISNTSEAYATRPRKEMKLLLPISPKQTKRLWNTEIILRYTKFVSGCERPVIGIRHEQHCVLLVQRSRCWPLNITEMCPIGKRLVPVCWILVAGYLLVVNVRSPVSLS